MIKSIVVVGGGAAGWITAGVIAARHNSKTYRPFSITLVESPSIGILGVGEGTWPTMGQTLQRLRISENAFIQQCDASFKQGTRFQRWVTGADEDRFYHPFSVPQGFEQISVVPQWQEAWRHMPFAHAVGLQPTLCDQQRGPKQIDAPEYSSVENYGYHLDANKFAKMLSGHCTQQLGVRHVPADIIGVNSAANGDIRSLSTKEGGEIEGDLFIDCSGHVSLLIGKHYKVPFISCRDVLFIDRALAVQVPYESETSPIESVTVSTAQTAGWIWDIGLATRRGVGHVFSSRHTSAENAEAELKSYLRPHCRDADALQARELRFDPGFRERFWVNNCVAVGMSAGFLEPLEASALVLVELAANTISLHLPATRYGMDAVAKVYNERFRFRWDRIIDFLKLHYALSRRSDSAFWRENREDRTVPESLRDLLALWRHQAPVNNGFLSPYDLFPAASYQYILYGMGYPTEFTALDRAPATCGIASEHLAAVEDRKKRISPLLPSNRQLVTAIRALDLNGLLDLEKDRADNWVAVTDAHIPRLAEHYPLFFRRSATYGRYQCIALLGLRGADRLLSPPVAAEGPVDQASMPPAFGVANRLHDLGLLEPVKLNITLADKSTLTIKGIHALSQAKLRSMSAQALDSTLAPIVQAMTSSVRHVQTLIDKTNRAP